MPFNFLFGLGPTFAGTETVFLAGPAGSGSGFLARFEDSDFLGSGAFDKIATPEILAGNLK